VFICVHLWFHFLLPWLRPLLLCENTIVAVPSSSLPETTAATSTLEAFRELAPGLWVAERPQRILGADIGTRMTVVRLAAGGLVVHSPVPLGWQTRYEIDQLGAVKIVIAPNRFHHLYVKDYADHYPDARIFCAPGLEKKRRDLSFHGILSDTPDPLWAADLDQVVFRAVPMLNEVVFFHPGTRTLIVADLVFNVQQTASRFTRLVLRLDGAYGRFGVGRLDKWLVRDRAGARRTIDRILEWDFDRIILAHGNVVESGGKPMLREAFAWL
jgi:hypothetical protein